MFLYIAAFALSGCGKSDTPAITHPVTVLNDSQFAKGADVSWLTQMEASGYTFRDSTGAATECMKLLTEYGINAIRLRVWVNPANGWCDSSDVLAKAIRADKLGLRILLDFHYSDTWADPGKQAKPAAWTTLDSAALSAAVYSHTYNVLSLLKRNNITPKWVQTGNETSDGMLWEDGRASTHMARFAALINAGYKAVKANSDSTLVIVHLPNGYDNGLYRWLFDGLKVNGTEWDAIGMSLYPEPDTWAALDVQCATNMVDMISRYNKPVMICETGMAQDQPEACRQFLADIIGKTNALGKNGLGVFYWEPECYNSWQGYNKGAFDNTGRPTSAMNAFRQ